MLTFYTRYFGAGERRGSRIKVWTRERKPMWIKYDHAITDMHKEAVLQYIESGASGLDADQMRKYGWTGKLMCAEYDENGYAYIPLYKHTINELSEGRVNPLLFALKELCALPNKHRMAKHWYNAFVAIAMTEGRAIATCKDCTYWYEKMKAEEA